MQQRRQLTCELGDVACRCALLGFVLKPSGEFKLATYACGSDALLAQQQDHFFLMCSVCFACDDLA